MGAVGGCPAVPGKWKAAIMSDPRQPLGFLKLAFVSIIGAINIGLGYQLGFAVVWASLMGAVFVIAGALLILASAFLAFQRMKPAEVR